MNRSAGLAVVTLIAACASAHPKTASYHQNHALSSRRLQQVLGSREISTSPRGNFRLAGSR